MTVNTTTGTPFHLLVAGEVRSWRARLGTQQRDLARALGCSQQQLSKRLTGLIPFTIDELFALSRYWDIGLGPDIIDPAVRLMESGRAGSVGASGTPKPKSGIA